MRRNELSYVPEGINLSIFEWYILNSRKLKFPCGPKPKEEIRVTDKIPQPQIKCYNSLNMFLGYILNAPILTKEQQLILGREKNYYGWAARHLWEEGNGSLDSITQEIHNLVGKMMEPINELLVCNLKYVVKVARQLSKHRSLEDRIANGIRGLFDGIIRYDPRKDNTLITYAKWWIMRAISQAQSDLFGEDFEGQFLISTPINIIYDINRVKRWISEYIMKHGKEPDIKAIKQKLKGISLSERSYEKSKNFLKLISLDEPLRQENGDKLFMYNIIPDPTYNGNGSDPLTDNLYLTELRMKIEEAMKMLTLREREIIKLRFGLGNQSSRTLEEVAMEFNLSRERIRQIEKKVLERLRKRPSIRRLHIDLVI